VSLKPGAHKKMAETEAASVFSADLLRAGR